jgi:Regulator of ribonuclease activity B
MGRGQGVVATMRHPNDDNGDALRRLEAEGDDLSRPRDIDFNVVFPDEIRAKEFAQQFQREGYRTTLRLANVVKTHLWEVVIVKNMIPTHSGITDFERELQRMADTLCGYNDGWGCFSQPSGHLQ